MTIDKTAAVESARDWAYQVKAWPKCGMVQGLMVREIIAAAKPDDMPDDAYDRLTALAAQWRKQRACNPLLRSSDQMLWTIEQLEICLGLSQSSS